MNFRPSFRRVSPANGIKPAGGRSVRTIERGFTIVEVMMAATILVAGFIGMIQAITIGSEMMSTARRQTLANQIITHETEKLRLQSWTTINALPAGPTAMGAAWAASTNYYVADLVTYNSTWYRCKAANSGQTPAPGSSYWSVDTPPYANVLDTGGNALGTAYTLTRTTTDVVAGELREVQFTLRWTKSGTTTAAVTPTGGMLDQIGFASSGAISRTYTRKSVSYFGRYGLNLGIQRS